MANPSVGRNVRRVVVAALALIAVAALTGYFVFRIQTPVSLEGAVERFHAGNDGTTAGRHEVSSTGERLGNDKLRRGDSKVSTAGQGDGSRTTAAVAGADPAATATHATSLLFDMIPAEGVYTYVGTGEESVWPYSRDFPSRVTYRTITHKDRNTWEEHHIFSEQRASWTRLSTSETGRISHHQRNYIKIGPIAESRTIAFTPPIQAVHFPPHVGEAWEGEFTGRTEADESYRGTYTCRMVVDEQWNVGGTRTRVLGYELDVVFEGDVDGTVSVNYWFSPHYGLTVREEYSADAKVGPFDYHGEWFVELRSFTPHT